MTGLPTMNESEVTDCVDRLAAALGTNIRQTTKQRHVGKLQKAEHRPLVEVRFRTVHSTHRADRCLLNLLNMQSVVLEAKAGLAARAAAIGMLPNFNTTFDRLAPHSIARDNFTVLLWKISQDQDLLAALSPSERAENRAISANQTPTADQSIHRGPAQPGAGSCHRLLCIL